jgi:hypothetical protein
MDSVSGFLVLLETPSADIRLLSANAAEEFFVRQSPLYEVVGQLGMWGTLIIGIQAAGLEHKGMRNSPWNGPIGEFRSIHS